MKEERTNNKLEQHIASMPGFEPGHRWLKTFFLSKAKIKAESAKDTLQVPVEDRSLHLEPTENVHIP